MESNHVDHTPFSKDSPAPLLNPMGSHVLKGRNEYIESLLILSRKLLHGSVHWRAYPYAVLLQLQTDSPGKAGCLGMIPVDAYSLCVHGYPAAV